jgi:hypothetical protein
MRQLKASKTDYQHLIDTLNKVKEVKGMDMDMTPSLKKQLAEVNIIFDEGDHFATEMKKAQNPVEFLNHSAFCGVCIRVQVRNGAMKTLEEFQDWTHKTKEVQCEKFGHSKWLQENLYVLN